VPLPIFGPSYTAAFTKIKTSAALTGLPFVVLSPSAFALG
jgi:hypothetical protein